MKNLSFKTSMSIPISFKKFFFLIFLFVLGCQSLFSQCKLERSKDDFSSNKFVSSKDITLISVFPIIGSKKPWNLDMSFMLVDSLISISMTHKSQSYSTSLSSIYFKFQDGTIIKNEMPSTSSNYNDGLGYDYKITSFSLTKDELLSFASKDLLKFRADFKHFPDYPIVENEFNSKSIDKIRKDASCILDEFNSVRNTKKDDKKEKMDLVEYKCGYEIDKIDEFNKKRIVLTRAAIIFDDKLNGGHTYFQVCGSNLNSVNGLKFYRCFNVNRFDEVDQTNVKNLMLFDQVELLLENDDVISLKNDVVSEYLIQNQANSAWSYKLFTIDNDSIWQKLKSNPLKMIKLSMNGKDLGLKKIDNIYSKSIINAINCIDILGINKSK